MSRSMVTAVALLAVLSPSGQPAPHQPAQLRSAPAARTTPPVNIDADSLRGSRAHGETWSTRSSVRASSSGPGTAAPSAPLSSPGADGSAGAAAGPSGVVPQEPLAGVFGASSVWRRSVSTAPLAEDSPAMVSGLAQQVSSRYGGIAAFNAYEYNTSFYGVDASVPRRDVVFDDCQNKGYTPPQLYDSARGAHFTSVPIPDSAVPSPGTDGEMSVWDPSSDQYWEFWRPVKQPDGWHACWGGRIDHASTAPGYFSDGMGASSSGLAVAPGAVGIADARAGHIDHALSLAIVDTASWTTWVYPAQRSDGDNPTNAPHRIPHGTRLRLDPAVDVASLHLSPVAAMVARAAQEYGFIVTDKAGAVSVSAESGAGLRATTGVDPWDGILGSTPPYLVMQGFPWDRLQVLSADWR